MVYIKFGIVFELFVYKIYGDSDGAFLCGTEILNSRLNEMDFIFKALFCYFIHFNLDFNEILAILISQGENINECITLSFININASH